MSSGACPTVRIKTEPCKGNEAGFVDINEADFNAEIHKLFEEKAEQAPIEIPVKQEVQQVVQLPVETVVEQLVEKEVNTEEKKPWQK